jgi:membrane protein YdbS with pleckstrin-like domain
VSDFIIRPTLKFVKAGAIVAALIFLALEIAYLAEWRDQAPAWVMALPPLILLWPLVRWVKLRVARIVVSGDRLRYEIGIVSKDVRTIELSKLQYVRVHQGPMQRMFRVGDLGFETAGQGTWEQIRHVENPQQLADELMNRAKGTPQTERL